MEHKPVTTGMKLLAIPVVLVGAVGMVAHYWYVYGAMIIGAVLAFLIALGCIRGCKSLFTFFGFLPPAGFTLFALSVTIYNYISIGYLWVPNLGFVFPVIALTSACILSLRIRSAARKGIQKKFLWWFPGVVFALGVLQERITGIVPYSGYRFVLYQVLSGMAGVLMLLYVFWLLRRDYQYLLSAAAPVTAETPAPRQNAAASPLPVRQNASAAAHPQSAAAPQRERTPEGVTCPQCGATVPTAGRKTGMVFCTECGASVDLGGTANGVVDDALAEQIATLKRMLDGDLITQEEFDAKKRQLLGL